MGIVLTVIGVVLFFRESDASLWFVAIGGLFVICGLIYPTLLKPLYRPWMIFAVILGWFMTRLILALLFYLIITPIGLITRILGKLSIDIGWKKEMESYWTPIESNDQSRVDHEKQY